MEILAFLLGMAVGIVLTLVIMGRIVRVLRPKDEETIHEERTQ